MMETLTLAATVQKDAAINKSCNEMGDYLSSKLKGCHGSGLLQTT